MGKDRVHQDAAAIHLFPEYASLYALIEREVEGLSKIQLDFESDYWEWSKWSIRRQLSHMASLIYRWLLVRWGKTLFPNNDHGINDVNGLANSEFDRRMDENRYWDYPIIMENLRTGLDLVQDVLNTYDISFLRSHSIIHNQGSHWKVMLKAHPHGVTRTDDPSKGVMLLEASIRHIYFEELTHLYNIQRLKRAQGLGAIVNIPRKGYWVQDGWDISEPDKL